MVRHQNGNCVLGGEGCSHEERVGEHSSKSYIFSKGFIRVKEDEQTGQENLPNFVVLAFDIASGREM
jgi:hypothetical protein